jgi:hypothetical protein
VVSDALANLIASLELDSPTLRRDVAELEAAVGLEERERELSRSADAPRILVGFDAATCGGAVQADPDHANGYRSPGSIPWLGPSHLQADPATGHDPSVPPAADGGGILGR